MITNSSVSKGVGINKRQKLEGENRKFCLVY